jgi:hypothetical protein
MVSLQLGRLFGASVYTRAIIGIFGAVLPMIFGMAYLLLPSYAGQTLATPSVPGVHFVFAYVGVSVLVVDTAVGADDWLFTIGVGLWSLGVGLFVGSLAYTIFPAVVTDSVIVTRADGRPQRSTRVATTLIPVAIGYLLFGTLTLASSTTVLPVIVGYGLPTVVHYYGTGVATLLIFALGVRLLTGFFHVTPPRYVSWSVLGSGGLGPALLASNLWQSPWFEIGASLLVVAMAGYGVLVGFVVFHTTRYRIGLVGIGLGAVCGIGGVFAAILGLVGRLDVFPIHLHTTLVLDGFLLLTIIGYAYQFFPVTTGQFRGASRRTALATMLVLTGGVGIDILGSILSIAPLQSVGAGFGFVATSGYAYLLVRRFLW